jgi:hypothetical protein
VKLNPGFATYQVYGHGNLIKLPSQRLNFVFPHGDNRVLPISQVSSENQIG